MYSVKSTLESKNTKLQSPKKLFEKVQTYNPSYDKSLLEKAYSFSKTHHQGQKRYSGEPYINHPLQVALILTDLKNGCVHSDGGSSP